ncbi:MAG: hypothetical protein M1546_04260, partial [Chloroflexi bacterium]|nr:hypothetical protein [Chloroflexota bacterium]
WMATAMRVFARLFLWGAVAVHRDETLIQCILDHVRQAAQRGQTILFAVDGFKSYVTVIRKTFRDPRPTGQRGRPRLIAWPEFPIVQVVKKQAQRKLVSVTRHLVQGSQRVAAEIVQATQVGLGAFNTAYIERLNATFRAWLPALFRRSRHPARLARHLELSMFWMGVVYNFCCVHDSLGTSPAVAANLTDHVWSIDALLRFRTRRE